MIAAYIRVLQKYAVFNGRANRPEYWWFTLTSIIISVVLAIVSYALIGDDNNIIGLVYGLAVLLPSLGVSVRRLHDTGRSGWWILVGLIPFIGWIVLIVFMATKSNEDENQYGPQSS